MPQSVAGAFVGQVSGRNGGEDITRKEKRERQASWAMVFSARGSFCAAGKENRHEFLVGRRKDRSMVLC